MPDDSDRLNNETIYGASRSIQVLSNHVVTGTKADSRSDVEMSLNTGGGNAPSVADLISATFLSK